MKISALREGEKVALRSIISLAVLGTLKLTAFFITNMTVILADAVSTFADTLGLVAAYFGLRISRKSANEEFSYGYYKVETFMAFLISLGIVYLGFVILTDSIQNIVTPPQGDNRAFAITTTVFSLIMSYRLAKKLDYSGKKLNSLALVASAKDKKMDVFAALAVLVSIIANYKGIPYVEGLISSIISILILKEGIFSTKESLFYLLDYWNDPILKNKIKKVLRKNKTLVKSVKQVRLRRAGTYIFGEAFLEINPYSELTELRDELEFLKDSVKDVSPYIKDFSILTHIQKKTKLKLALPITRDLGLDSKIATSLDKTKHYLFAEIDGAKVKHYYTKKLEKKDRQVLNLAKFLKDEKTEVLIDNDLNSLLYYNLRKINHILVYPNFSDILGVEETIKLLILDS